MGLYSVLRFASLDVLRPADDISGMRRNAAVPSLTLRRREHQMLCLRSVALAGPKELQTFPQTSQESFVLHCKDCPFLLLGSCVDAGALESIVRKGRQMTSASDGSPTKACQPNALISHYLYSKRTSIAEKNVRGSNPRHVIMHSAISYVHT